jgi:hypothetical protein
MKWHRKSIQVFCIRWLLLSLLLITMSIDEALALSILVIRRHLATSAEYYVYAGNKSITGDHRHDLDTTRDIARHLHLDKTINLCSPLGRTGST